MRIALVNGKGGVGKSTIGCMLAAEAYRHGLKTLLVDLDPQGSSLKWSAAAVDAGNDGPQVIGLGDNVRRELPRIAEGFDVVILDTPGRIEKRSAASLMVADLALVPLQPLVADVWEIEPMVGMIEAAQEIRGDGLIARALINKARKNTVSAKTVGDAVRTLGLTPLDQVVHLREQVSDALAVGLGVTTYAPTSAASNEIRKLFIEIEELLQPLTETRLAVELQHV